MVKVGFICEGDTEKRIVESPAFIEFLNSVEVSLTQVINATGNGNLLPKNIIPFARILSDGGAEKVIILTDLDEDKCITTTKNRIDPNNNYITIVSVRSIEAWFLADSLTLSTLFKKKYTFEFPENEKDPPEDLNKLLIQQTRRGIGLSKPGFAQRMINNGFAITNAAAHDNCNSAAYFVKILKSLAK